VEKVAVQRILLARHGHATSGPDHRWTRDDPLTELGWRQARELGAHLAGLRRLPDRVVASTATRALETAAACADALGLEVETDERLIEFGSGQISPFTMTELLEQMPYDDVWHPDDTGHDGESIGAFWRRTAEITDEIVAAGGRPLVVSHGGTTTAILRHLLGVAGHAPDAVHFHLDNASLTDVRVRVDRHGNRRVILRRLGETAYLTDVTEL
jgi:broad specificity phosphatase PhoE